VDFSGQLIRTDMRYVVKNYFWFGLEYGVSMVAGLATSVAFANLISPETYGLLQFILTIMSFLTLATLTRLNDSLTISVARGNEGGIGQIIRTKIKYGLLGSLAGVILSGYYFYQNNATLALLVLIAVFFVPLLNLPYLYSNYLAGKKNFQVLSIVNSVSSAVYSLAIVGALWLAQNVIAVVGAYFIINFIVHLAAAFYVFKKYPPNKATEDHTISYGKKISYLGVFNTIASSIDSIFIFHYLGAIDLAAYAFAKKMPEKLKDLLSFLAALGTPKYATQDISDSRVKKEALRKSLILTLATLLVILLYVAAAPFIFKWLFPAYLAYARLSVIYALSIPIAAFGTLLITFMESARQIKSLAKFNIIFAVLKTLIMFLAIRYYGLSGLVWSFLFTRALSSAMITYYFIKGTDE